MFTLNDTTLEEDLTQIFQQIRLAGRQLGRQEVPQPMNTSGKYYVWQLFDGRNWFQIENDHVIESNYCQLDAKGITIFTHLGNLYIDFDTMAITGPFQCLAIRRLLSLSHNQRENVGWYFRDKNCWSEYGTQGSSTYMSSVSSQDIEQQYNSNPTGSFSFTAGKYKYVLNFSAMTQTNLSTQNQRNVRRRPKFNSVVYVHSSLNTSEPSTSTINPFPLPAPSVSPSTTVTWQFMGDEGMWTNYQKPGSSLDSVDIEREYQRNPQGQLAFTAGRYSYSLYFNGMYQINLTYKTRRAVQRISADQSNIPLCQVRWQFKDMDGRWKDFVKGTGKGKCSVSIQEIEMQYQQNSAGVMYYNSDQFRYMLNFSEMTQTNLTTRKQRPVRRV
ncbi:uncharacterized protein si:ch211-244b2.3 isoform X2 [Hemibagrus wyckioides]|nr:uncharacterized protein si:ch211-244b2.3 isoform X2 [Hemibagrus wyckioides]